MTDMLHCPAVLALELAPGTRATQLMLDRDAAAALAGEIAADLHRLLPGAEIATLAVAGALYDSAQLLRPGWPVYAALGELAARRPSHEGAQIVAFGANEGRMPIMALTPEVPLTSGSLLLVPWLLLGASDAMQALGARMEQEFLIHGEIGIHTADFVMRRLSLRLEHARYLTRHDLCALTRVQLEQAGFGALWELLEVALLAPGETHEVLSARGRRWHYAGQAMHSGSPGYKDWFVQVGYALAPTERAHAYAGWLFELRQYAAGFAAHGLPWRIDGAADTAGYSLERVAEPRPNSGTIALFAHEAPGLGIVVVTAAQRTPHGTHIIAHGFPFATEGLAPLLDTLRAELDADAPLHRLGRIALDADATALTTN